MAATFTTRLALRKPDPDPSTGDFVNVATDISASMDKIDASIGAINCTSSARPASPYVGQFARETDTGNLIICTATPSTWARVFNAGQSAWTGTINHTNASVGVETVNTRVGAEANPRYLRTTDGYMAWGGGGALAPDTNLYRSAVDTLKTDDNMIVNQALSVTGNTTITGNLTVNGPAAWTTYTPAWTASAGTPAIGNGSLTGAYYLIGRTMFFQIKLVAGTTTTFGTAGAYWGLGIPSPWQAKRDMIGAAGAVDLGVQEYQLTWRLSQNSTTLEFMRESGRFTNNNTFAFANTDTLVASGVAEVF